MSIRDWAKNEVDLAISKSQNYYYISCLESALKMFNKICDVDDEDGHSGASMSIVKDVLIRFLDHMPLTEITEEDFKDVIPCYPDFDNLTFQCPRYTALFKTEKSDGTVTYDDVNRSYCKDINTGITFHSSMFSKYVDKNFPITLPYFPSTNKFVIYCEDFLYDKDFWDFDTTALYNVKKPDGTLIEVNKFYKEVKYPQDKDSKWVEITKEEFDERKANKVR